ncbi:MAG: hypothetical protein CBC34_003430 [Hyphomicrobiaceae bacterium TMED74]|nr:hypothetical protein [Filomicrobium sp.]RPG46237.1 MAG: hypothetical protein CBC34_003430 [Hyphomicrobiaceae bacterium TMED74]
MLLRLTYRLQFPLRAAAFILVMLCGALSNQHGAIAKDVAAAPEVGTTISVKRRLTGLHGDVKRRLRKGARVHRDEVLQTSRKGRAEFKLDDDTKLALGANAKLKLDQFVLGQT